MFACLLHRTSFVLCAADALDNMMEAMWLVLRPKIRTIPSLRAGCCIRQASWSNHDRHFHPSSMVFLNEIALTLSQIQEESTEDSLFSSVPFHYRMEDGSK
jgi:hypothetical protein